MILGEKQISSSSKTGESKFLRPKIGRAAQMASASGKRMGCFGNKGKIRNRVVGCDELEVENLRSDKIAEAEFARVAMVETAVLVRDLRFSGVVGMKAMLFRIGFDHVLQRMHRLEYNRRKHRHEQGVIKEEQAFFHSYKCTSQNVKISLTFCKINLKASFVGL